MQPTPTKQDVLPAPVPAIGSKAARKRPMTVSQIMEYYASQPHDPDDSDSERDQFSLSKRACVCPPAWEPIASSPTTTDTPLSAPTAPDEVADEDGAFAIYEEVVHEDVECPTLWELFCPVSDTPRDALQSAVDVD